MFLTVHMTSGPFPVAPRCLSITASPLLNRAGLQLVITWAGPADGSFVFLRGFYLEIALSSNAYPESYTIDLSDNGHLFSNRSMFSLLTNETFQMRCEYNEPLTQPLYVYVSSLPSPSDLNYLDDACKLTLDYPPSISNTAEMSLGITAVNMNPPTNGISYKEDKDWYAVAIITPSAVIVTLLTSVIILSLWRKRKLSTRVSIPSESDQHNSGQSEFYQPLSDQSEFCPSTPSQSRDSPNQSESNLSTCVSEQISIISTFEQSDPIQYISDQSGFDRSGSGQSLPLPLMYNQSGSCPLHSNQSVTILNTMEPPGSHFLYDISEASSASSEHTEDICTQLGLRVSVDQLRGSHVCRTEYVRDWLYELECVTPKVCNQRDSKTSTIDEEIKQEFLMLNFSKKKNV